MRSLVAPFVLVALASGWLIGCSPSPSDEPDDAAPGTVPTPALAPANDAPTTEGAAAISFNAAQTADTDTWFTQVEGAAACAANSSPAEAIARLQGIGATPSSLDTNAADGSLTEVVVSWSDERGARSTTFYRKLGDCEASLPSERSVPDQYK